MRFVDLVFWLLITLTDAYVLYLFVVRKLSRKFFFLFMYFLLAVTFGLTQFVIWAHSGWGSIQYFYFYYLSDGLLAVALLMSVFELSARLRAVSVGRLFALLVTGVVLAAMVSFLGMRGWFSSSHLARFLIIAWVENHPVVGSVVVLSVWSWKRRNNHHDRVAAGLVNVLSLYFLLLLIVDVAYVFARNLPVFGEVSTMAGAWLPIGCGFAAVSREPFRQAKAPR